MIKPTFLGYNKQIRIIVLLFIFGLSLVYGMKCFGLRQVMELDTVTYHKNHYQIYNSDAVLTDYEVLDRWYVEASVENFPLAAAYTYFHIRLKNNDIISVRIPTSQVKGGSLSGELRGEPDEMTKDETALEKENTYHSDYILRVKHGIVYYLISGSIAFILSIISVVMIFHTTRKYKIAAEAEPKDEYFDYDV